MFITPMVKRTAILLFAALLSCGAVSCKKDKKQQDEEKVQKYRAEQKKKAVNAYQEIVKKYPDSPYGEKAKERLRTLNPATPAKK